MAEGLKQRVITAIAFGIPFLAALFYSDLSRIILLAFIAIATAIEYAGLNDKKWVKNPFQIVSFLVIISLIALSALGTRYSDYSIDGLHDTLLYAALLVNTLFIIDLYTGFFPIHKKASWLANIIYAPLAYAVLISTAPELLRTIFISTIILIWISDSSAYFVGKSIGKNKLMPSVSPGKTWEGFLGAGMITLIIGYIISTIYTQYSMQSWILIALSIWLFGSLGDLVESKFKRSIEVKDSGSLLPGHGGLLDRFDGFFFCIPFVVYLVEKILS